MIRVSRKIIAATLAAVAALTLSLALALAPGWNLVGGTNQAPGAWVASLQGRVSAAWQIPVECAEPLAIYGWDAPTQSWLRFVPGAPAYVNTLPFMDALAGYWVYCP